MHRKKSEEHFSKDQDLRPCTRGIGITLRLFTLILALLLLMVISHLVSYRMNVRVTTSFENILKEIPHERAIYEIQTAITDYIMPANDFLITGDPAELKAAATLEKKCLVALDRCDQLARHEERSLIDRVRKDFDQIRFFSNQIMASDVQQREVAGKMMKKMDRLAVSTRSHIDELVKMHDLHMNKSRYAAEDAWRTANLWMIAIFIIATIVGLTIATYISLSILRPLKLLDDSAKRIAEGNLAELLHIDRKGEITSLANSFNQMILSLRHQIKTSKTILEAIADPIFTVDMAMNITYFSHACERLTGFTMNEVIGKKCYDIFQSDICEGRCAIKSSAVNGNPTYNVEVQIKAKDQKTIPIMASASSLKDEHDKIMGGCEIFRDISEQKRMIKELQEAQEQLIISEKMAALGRLASSVSHELRNPLAIIQNSTYYLKHKIGEQNPKFMKHIEIIEHEINGSNKIISELLGFCRTTKSELVPDDINRVIDSSLSRIQLQPTISIQKSLASDLPPVMLDDEQIHQVLVNLISNAEHAMMDTGGHIAITTRHKGGAVEVEITDQGCGIPPAHVEKIFDPFFTTKTKGIGLGLAITKSIIQNHNATITARSILGQGTSFIIIFPVNQEWSSASS
ncbi:MAG: ATP-binding protein [bacterium]